MKSAYQFAFAGKGMRRHSENTTDLLHALLLFAQEGSRIGESIDKIIEAFGNVGGQGDTAKKSRQGEGEVALSSEGDMPIARLKAIEW